MPGFSQPPLKKVLKGKGVLCRNQEALPECGGADAGPIDGKLDYARKVASDALFSSKRRKDWVKKQNHFNSSLGIALVSGFGTKPMDGNDIHETGAQDSRFVELQSQKHSNYQSSCMENKATVFFFNFTIGRKMLLSWFESFEENSVAMLDLRDRILPPSFLSENPREAGFCPWLLHPEPSSRPTASRFCNGGLDSSSAIIIHLDRVSEGKSCSLNYYVDLGELSSGNNVSTAPDNDDTEPGLLLHFLSLLKEQKQKHEAELLVDIECLEEDIKEVEKRHLLRTPKIVSETQERCLDSREQDLYPGSVAIF
ncbi:hypothetical protein NC652_032972 [Populus alba x Populus x berolinensis]|nr:hypothetical protein NC652_032972 [Populus alba x Populus x berolinensis]